MFPSKLAIRLACGRVSTHEDVGNADMPAAGIVKSVLPVELESKRIKIAKVHNLLVCVLLGLLFVGLLLITVLMPHGPTHKPSSMALVGAFLAIGLLEAYGICRVVQHDNELCRQLGYMCPFCDKPLYEARASTWVDGLCPKCHKSVL